MALGPSDPKQQKALVAILLAGVATFLVYQYVYTPKMEEVAEVQVRVETLEASNQRARVLAARGGGNIEEQLALYERHVMRLEELIPASEEVAALLRTITAEARRLGVEVAEVTPDPVEQGQFYTKEIYSMRAVGEYHAVGQFLTAIASLPRIITPVEMDLSRLQAGRAETFPDMEQPVVAGFRIETYVLPEAGQGPPPGDLGTEDGP
ncbi:MAG TPA: type 4a pilus biogenesis protein PilO [Longimicrobiales bacterium]|nr:type 4a pilus biogenesis protein PilO [Longimicrobiales bacterium]